MYNPADLRDQFAMAALQGILASTTESHSYGSFEDASDAAYKYADAMIRARLKGDHAKQWTAFKQPRRQSSV